MTATAAVWGNWGPDLLRGLSTVAAAGLAAYVAVYKWKLEERHRAERDAATRRAAVLDALEALEAALSIEIRNLRRSFDPTRNEPQLRAYRALIEGGGKFPVTVAGDSNVIFDLTRADLLSLPGIVSGTLAQYRMLDGSLTAAIGAMGAGLYDDVSPARQKLVLLNYHLDGEDTLATALAARALVRAYRASLTLIQTQGSLSRTIEAAPRSLNALDGRRALTDPDKRLLRRLIRKRVARSRLERLLGIAPRDTASDEGPDRSAHGSSSSDAPEI